MYFWSYSVASLQIKLCCLKVTLLKVCLYVYHIYLSMPYYTYSRKSKGNTKFQNLHKVMTHTILPTHFLCSEWYVRKLAAFYLRIMRWTISKKTMALSSESQHKILLISHRHVSTYIASYLRMLLPDFLLSNCLRFDLLCFKLGFCLASSTIAPYSPIIFSKVAQ